MGFSLSNLTQIQVIGLLGTLLCLSTVRAAYTVLGDDDNTCLYASFDVNVVVYHNVSRNSTNDAVPSYSIETITFQVPKATEDNVTVTGECAENGRNTLKVDWYNRTNFSLAMEFVKNSSWKLDQITFEYHDTGDGSEGDDTLLTYYTNDEQKFFNRTFKAHEYFYCDGCKQYRFSNYSGACVGSSCAYLTLEKSRIYLGDFIKENPKKKVCIEDWISAREVIVPIAVGGFLIFLVTILILAYIGTFIKRKFKERTTMSGSYSRMSQ